ncbi:DUF1273 domain-containing protein [Salisediminibacterium halotolerans]|uniref:DUF1273 domain-containing protein n=1 Tax=Salisediminibacterium halotolerans TaxID=517425 RepID=UPI000EACF38D|nr:DUF1273 domain-containing protein [Salisediminibacterium halotolerans]RLJ74080.1 putative phage-like protein YoqJ [Actinophytocola xinjiangensis]RPE87827.1 putative phage-like protein YoqJ [Salisediminibacterium halotolerans]TWG34917.1 putative phage-like protein YoqJ [Salisediminibacterium halotolerans]GEL07896.1 UPF0398 protein YpsA [Salisediminibacterium halotolerans]
MYKSAAVTGYKPHEIGVFNEQHEQLPYLKRALQKALTARIEEWDLSWIVITGQPGVELWAGEAALELKKNEFPDLKLAVLAPFYHQEERFPEPVKVLYQKVWDGADFKDYITKRPYENPSQLRMKNEFIAEKTDAALVLYDEEIEGTPKFFLAAAKKQAGKTDYPLVYVTPDDIEDLIREEHIDGAD